MFAYHLRIQSRLLRKNAVAGIDRPVGRLTWIHSPVELGQNTDAVDVKNRLDLIARSKCSIGKIAQAANSQTKRQSDETGKQQRQGGFRTAFEQRRRCGSNHPRFGDRERLLLNGLGVTLQEVVIQRPVGLRRTFQFSQRDLGLVIDLRVRDYA
jgi:hypothetical protein